MVQRIDLRAVFIGNASGYFGGIGIVFGKSILHLLPTLSHHDLTEAPLYVLVFCLLAFLYPLPPLFIFYLIASEVVLQFGGYLFVRCLILLRYPALDLFYDLIRFLVRNINFKRFPRHSGSPLHSAVQGQVPFPPAQH